MYIYLTFSKKCFEGKGKLYGKYNDYLNISKVCGIMLGVTYAIIYITYK